MLTSAQKMAIVAACSVPGCSKSRIAKDFNVRPEVVSRLLKGVKDVQNESNPLSKDWKERSLGVAQTAVIRGMKHKSDPVGAANVALKLMHGTGYLLSGTHVQIEGNVALTVTWLPTQMPEYETDSEKVIDAPHTLISD